VGGVIPIVHSNSGCAIQNNIAAAANGYMAGHLRGCEIPSTNVYEKQVVFGGASRLREQIKNTVRVMRGDLYVVLSGCASEMVGDDVSAMTKEIVEQGENASFAETPGFKGDQFVGYEKAVKAILSALPAEKTAADAKLVNILGIVPSQDICWQGNLYELKRIFHRLGLRPNLLFGYGQSLDAWREIPNAALNLVVSAWGLSAARDLESRYGTPQILADGLGLGPDIQETIQSIAQVLPLKSEDSGDFLSLENDRFYYHLSNLSEYYYDRDFQKKTLIVGEKATVLRHARFLHQYLGFPIADVVVTDVRIDGDESAERKNAVEKAFSGISENVNITSDSFAIRGIIKNSPATLVLGSSLEAASAKRYGKFFATVSAPALHSLLFTKSDIGYGGAYDLLETLAAVFMAERS
jgi:nitrogenase molybdenum-iron protein beta chain